MDVNFTKAFLYSVNNEGDFKVILIFGRAFVETIISLDNSTKIVVEPRYFMNDMS